MQEPFDVAIVGSGAGGLTAAAKASKKGLNVILLEAMPYLGGYLNPFERNGFSFDTGLHYLGQLGKGETFTKLLERIGIADKLKFLRLNDAGFARYRIGETEFSMPAGEAALKESLLSLFPNEQSAIESFLSFIHRANHATTAAAKVNNGLFAKLRFLRHMPFLVKTLKRTYGEVLDEITTNDKLKALFSIFSGEAGLPAYSVSALSLASVFLHYMNGAYYPQGGSRALKDALVSTIESNGATIVKNAKVLNISRNHGVFELDTEKRGNFYAKSVILNTEAYFAFTQILNPELVPYKLRNKAINMKPSHGAFYAFVGTDLDIAAAGITDANEVYAQNEREMLYERSPKEVIDDFPSAFLITSPSIKDPNGKHAPQGMHTLEIITMMPYEPFTRWEGTISRKRGKEYESFKNELGERLLERVEQLYLPSLCNHIRFVEFATPLSNAYWVGAYKGGCYGPAALPSQVGPGRFSTNTGIEGVFLAGASVIGGGVFPSMLSGELAASGVLKFLSK